jgi:hypothetical protein
MKMPNMLLGFGSLHESFYRRSWHQEQHCLRLCGGFEEFDISLPQICVNRMVLVQIIQGLQANLCNAVQVDRHGR